MKVPQKQKWIEGMEDEMHSHQKNVTWDIVKPNKTIQSLIAKQIFHVKTNVKDEIECFKAYLVIRGFEQQYGVNYKENISPVIRYDTVCSLFWLFFLKKLK